MTVFPSRPPIAGCGSRAGALNAVSNAASMLLTYLVLVVVRVAHVDHPAEYGEQQVPLPSDEKRTTRCPLLLFGVSVVTAVAVTVTTIVCIHTTFR